LRPGSNIKTKRFEFTPETVACNVVVAQVGGKTVAKSIPVARQQRSSCRRMCCLCVERGRA